MASGEATIRSCPIIIAAWPTLLVGGGTLASAAGSPSSSLRPRPKSAAGVGERVRLQLAGQRDEGGVARLREVAAERHRAGGVALEVAERLAVDGQRARALDRAVDVEPGAQQRGRRHHLERRAGRVEAGQRAVVGRVRGTVGDREDVARRGWTATSAALPLTGASASSAAACTRRSSVVRSGRARRPGRSSSVLPAAPVSRSRTTTLRVAAPPSRSW